MPNPALDLIMPQVSPVSVSLEPVISALHSLWLLLDADNKTGLGDWVTRTAAALTPEERERHRLVLVGFFYAILPEQDWPSFPAYLDHLATCDPIALRDKLLMSYAHYAFPDSKEQQDKSPPVDWEAVLESKDTYVSFLIKLLGAENIDKHLEAQAYSYIVAPSAMQDLIVTHLRKMWVKFLAPEWERTSPMLQDAVTAFRQIDLSNMSKLEAARLITGQSVEGEPWYQDLEIAERVVFAPTTHVGPYLGKFCDGATTAWVFFGPRIPEGVQFHTPDLSRVEIVVRLNALADDTRLRILKLISEKGELRSQDIMQSLDLSQSAASRHLKQLSATGYLFERRHSGAKCYKLNPQRIKDTLQAASIFLLGS